MKINSRMVSVLSELEKGTPPEALHAFYAEELAGTDMLTLFVSRASGREQDIIKDRCKVFDPELLAFDTVMELHLRKVGYKALKELLNQRDLPVKLNVDDPVVYYLSTFNIERFVVYKNLLIDALNWTVYNTTLLEGLINE